MNNRKVGFVIAWLLLVIASLACGEVTVSNEEGPAKPVFRQITEVDETSSLCPYDVAQIRQELRNLSRMAQQGTDGGIESKMIVALRVLGDIQCTEEVAQFKMREELELANISLAVLEVESCYTGQSIAQDMCRSTAALYDNDTSDCDINYEYEVNQCYKEFSSEIDRICRNSDNGQACESNYNSVKSAHQPR